MKHVQQKQKDFQLGTKRDLVLTSYSHMHALRVHNKKKKSGAQQKRPQQKRRQKISHYYCRVPGYRKENEMQAVMRFSVQKLGSIF